MKIRSRLDFIIEYTVKEKNSRGHWVYIKKDKEITFSSKQPTSITQTNLHDVLREQANIISSTFETISGNGEFTSNWRIKRWVKYTIDMFKIKHLRAGSYIPTPERYSNPKCGIVNVKNNDQECFRWCIKYHQSVSYTHLTLPTKRIV